MTQRIDFEQELKNVLETLPESRIRSAMAWSLYDGGKRIRPNLLFAALESYGLDPAEGLPFATGLEMIHTYSLIHDDLPAMDDDAMRRGKPSCHIQFDEAAAILAGDALLTLGLGQAARQGAEFCVLLAEKSGAAGMVYGQELDLEAEQAASLTAGQLEQIDACKTGCLLQAPLMAAAMIAGRPEDVPVMEELGRELGIAFQIQDDILDVTSSEEVMGKSLSDAGLDKATFVKLLGLEPAKEQVSARKAHIFALLDQLHLQDAGALRPLLESIFNRDR